jgi:hypothetical protein
MNPIYKPISLILNMYYSVKQNLLVNNVAHNGGFTYLRDGWFTRNTSKLLFEIFEEAFNVL